MRGEKKSASRTLISTSYLRRSRGEVMSSCPATKFSNMLVLKPLVDSSDALHPETQTSFQALVVVDFSGQDFWVVPFEDQERRFLYAVFSPNESLHPVGSGADRFAGVPWFALQRVA